MLYCLLVLEHLMVKFCLGSYGSKRVIVGLAEEFDTTGGCEGAEAVENLGSVAVKLL